MLRELVTARGNRLQLPLQSGALDACITLNVLDSSALNSEVRAPLIPCQKLSPTSSCPPRHPGCAVALCPAGVHEAQRCT